MSGWPSGSLCCRVNQPWSLSQKNQFGSSFPYDMYFEATSIGSFKASKTLHKQQLRFGNMDWWHCLSDTALEALQEALRMTACLAEQNSTYKNPIFRFNSLLICRKNWLKCDSDLQNVVSSSIFSFRFPSVFQVLSSSRVGHSSVHCGIHSTTSSISTCSFSGFHCPTPGLVTNVSFLKN